MTKRSTAKPQLRVPARSTPSPGPPGTRVVWSFGAIGDLELHRLNVPADFTCATCGERRQADLAATVKGSWSVTVCHSCYLTQIADRVEVKYPKQPRQKPKKPGRTHASIGQAHQGVSAAPAVPRPRIAVAGPPNERPRHVISTETPKPAGMRQLLHFFWTAGVLSWMSTDGDLYVRGEFAGQLRDLPHPESDSWRQAVDRIAWRHAHDVLVRAVTNNARYSGSLEAILFPKRMASQSFAVVSRSRSFTRPTRRANPR
jgi:hypothetical protein